MKNTWNKNLRPVHAALAVTLAALGAWSGCSKAPQPAPASGSGYSAVLMSNGSVYFGKLEGLGSPYPVLRDVYYVQTSTNPETKQVTSILVKRGGEWHSPDHMTINEKAIVLVEPVGPDSKVAQLIAQSKK